MSLDAVRILAGFLAPTADAPGLDVTELSAITAASVVRRQRC
ncbi:MULTISPECIES: hypothetical protein [Mycobacteriaceae]|nr:MULTISPECIES: hypothetical protein [Mycobacterium]